MKGSNNRHKSRIKVAKLHNKIANCRSDFHHKLSRRIVNENLVICVESLAVSNMVKNHPPAFGSPLNKGGRGDPQVGWGQFCTMLKYKAEQEGKIYQEVDRFFPSSKTCRASFRRGANLSHIPLGIWVFPLPL
ncbi:MAG: transposase [Xenococcaceae cyanobacterium MO_207.B15]|nr:transposase [Xenococcaceae cyanobacterium MO_207.B15]